MNSPAQPSGLLLFDKPKGITSHDAVDLLRGKLGVRRIGHTGTLDPMATGLLVMLVGGATSAQASLQATVKVYGGTVSFGAETDTWDAEGKVTARAPAPALDDAAVQTAVAAFSGKVTQQVPPYSAIKVNGRKLYDLARKGEAVPEIRRETELKWLSWAVRSGELDFEIECSGGTYLRSVAHELGRAMGSAAHLSALRRLAVGAWRVDGAVTAPALDKLTREEALALLRPVPAR